MTTPGGRTRRPRTTRRPPSRLALQAVAGDRGLTLADFCAQRGGISLHDARAAIERGGAHVNGKRVENAARAMRSGDSVELHLLERGEEPHAEALGPERLLFLDAHLLAVDKPAGVLAQEGLAGGPDLPTLATALLESRKEKGPALLVHRLDRGTTGVTLLARTKEAQTKLLAAFRDGKVKKEYLVLCAGLPKTDSFVIDLALGDDETTAGRRRPDPLGQHARTRVRVLRRFESSALLAAFPETGRTHQIRVHLAEQGLPLLGDARYGGPRSLTRKGGARIDFTRPMLHARSLSTAHPAGGRVDVEAPEPADLTAAIAFLAGED